MAAVHHLRTTIRTSVSSRPTSGVSTGSAVSGSLAANIALKDADFDWWLMVRDEIADAASVTYALDDFNGRTTALGQTIAATHLQYVQIQVTPVDSATTGETLSVDWVWNTTGPSLVANLHVGAGLEPGRGIWFAPDGYAVVAGDELSLEAAGDDVVVDMILAGKGVLS